MIVAGSASPLLLASATGGYNLTRSLRFRESAGSYLRRTPSSATNRKTWTFSAWVKLGNISSTVQTLLSAVSGSANTSIYFSQQTTFNLKVRSYNGSTVPLEIEYAYTFRDPSAWYHIVVAFDTTQATNTNRIKFYVNGTQQTATNGVASYPAQDYETYVNNNNIHDISNYANAGVYSDQYLTEINFIDGQALTPSSFGETSATTGVWQPKKFVGTYGTNGFYLPFTDNSALTTSSNVGLGKDFSGNGNFFATNNISITAGSTYDSMTDVPTLTSATAANYCVLNPLTGDATESSANLNLTGVDVSTIGTMSFASTGKWYFEMDCVSNVATTNNDGVGIATFPINDTSPSKVFYIYRSGGVKLQSGGSNTAYGATFTTGDVIGVAYDADAGTLVFYKNNSSQGTAFTGISGTFFPVVYARGITSTPVLALNCGQRGFAYTPPTGFVALNTFNLPTPTIGATASTLANKYFDATLYTGTGAAQTITNSGGFQPDFVWGKARSTARSNVLVDAVRGSSKDLYSNLTDAENTDATVLTSFNSNGFSLGTDGELNLSANTFVAWQWRASNATAVSNTAGSITSTVSANTSAGFSIVTYTGTGSAATVGHGLGVSPSMIIVKNRSGANDWPVWNINLSSSNYFLTLNTTSGQTFSPSQWGGSPTSSIFNVSTSANTNGSGNNYVAYCFSEVAGYSKFGSYVGNGSADGPFAYTGFRPKFIMTKNTTNASDWVIYNTATGTYNVVGPYLFANSTSSEGNLGVIDILSNGFKSRYAGNASLNENGSTFIYMAFAENPFKYSLAR
jgi:hypothetical protein